jgi:hypothetical protein
MQNKKWPGIMILESFQLRNGTKILYEEYNKPNILHVGGETQILQALFVGGNTTNTYIPTDYYIGLDNRTTLSETDVLSSLVGEPTGNGYVRYGVSATTGFTIETSGTTVKAKTAILTFSATGSSWGPVKNVFLTNASSGTSGVLYSSVALSSPATVSAGNSITLRFSMALRNC